MGIFDDDFDLDRDLADLDGDGHVDAFEAALFFDEMEREDRAIERGLSLGSDWSRLPDDFNREDDDFDGLDDDLWED